MCVGEPLMPSKASLAIAILATVLFLSVMPSTLAVMTAEQHPAGYGRVCFPCHDLLLTPSEYNKKLGNCACHNIPSIWNGNHINMANLDKLHGDGPCIKCHLGPNYSNVTPITVHIPHVDVSCYECHGKNMIKLPPTTDCHYCHKGGIHEIHGRILMKICAACHGQIIYKYLGSASKVVNVNVTEKTKPEQKPFSLLDVLKSLLSHLILRIP